MINKKVKERYEELKKTIAYHANKYYNDDAPEISDFEYDMLMLELRNIELQNPEIISADSPTQVIVAEGAVDTHFSEVVHEVPLQSLQDVFSTADVVNFVERIEKEVASPTYVVEAKIDGLSVALEYKKGKFVRGATRGNGLVGEDVTVNLNTIKSIPQTLKDEIDIIVRGEVYLPHAYFEKINEDGTLKLFVILCTEEIGCIHRKTVGVTDKNGINDVKKGNGGTRSGKSFRTEKNSRDRGVDDIEGRGKKR